MYGWIVGAMIRRAVNRLNEGDPGPLLAGYADDVHFVFPGESSFAADIHSKAELEAWLRRFVEAGLQLELAEIIVTGWLPWNLTVCVRLTDRSRPRRRASLREPGHDLRSDRLGEDQVL